MLYAQDGHRCNIFTINTVCFNLMFNCSAGFSNKQILLWSYQSVEPEVRLNNSMGNQLTGVAPSQILPVEQYLTDVPHFHFVEKYVFNFILVLQVVFVSVVMSVINID